VSHFAKRVVQILTAPRARQLAAAALCLAVYAAGSSASAQSAKEFRWAGDAEGGAPFVEADPSHPAHNRTFDLYLEVKARFEPITHKKTIISTDHLLEDCVQHALAAIT